MSIADNLAGISKRCDEACLRAGRAPGSVKLIAVSKTFPLDAVREAHDAGQLCFGESKVQEAEPKIAMMPSNLSWHFIGRVQRNKMRKVLQDFEVIHAIDSLKLASHANDISGELGLFPKVFLQVNLGGEASKGGFSPEALRFDMEKLLGLPQIDIQGLMCIPPPGSDASSARPWFVSLRELRNALLHEFDCSLPSLSMGMSGDFEVAIEEGATHVRVGSAIFGNRSYRVDGELG